MLTAFSFAVASMGMLLVAVALRAVARGDLVGPRSVVHGNFAGEAHLMRRQRPLAFWLCVLALLGFGLLCLGAAWLLLPPPA